MRTEYEEKLRYSKENKFTHILVRKKCYLKTAFSFMLVITSMIIVFSDFIRIYPSQKGSRYVSFAYSNNERIRYTLVTLYGTPTPRVTAHCIE